MKCPKCMQLNMDTDTHCYFCKAALTGGSSSKGDGGMGWNHPDNPQWAYFFAVACGIIPVVALGGCVPVALGLGGASMCLTVARAASLPSVVRILTCTLITGGAWLCFGAMVVAVMTPDARRRVGLH